MPLNLKQPLTGYRYAIDSYLLADFCEIPKSSLVLDLGSGCGILTLLLANSFKDSYFIGVEIQNEAIKTSQENIVEHAFYNNISLIKGNIKDISSFFPKRDFDLVVTNPPYYKLGSGRINSDYSKACAKHELLGTLKDFIAAGNRVLKDKGLYYLIYTTIRFNELIMELVKNFLEPKTIRFIHSKNNVNSSLVLIKCIKKAKTEVKILPPLIIYDINNKYTGEIEAILNKFNFS